MTNTTAPAVTEPVEIARHMSTKVRGWGLVIHRRGRRYTVAQVSRINGGLVFVPFADCDTEQEAREAANRQWRIGKAHGEY